MHVSACPVVTAYTELKEKTFFFHNSATAYTVRNAGKDIWNKIGHPDIFT